MPKVTKKKSPRKRIEKDGKFYTARGVELTRACNTKTEAEFAASILSALRNATKFWLPKMMKLREGRREGKNEKGKSRFENTCEHCKKWFPMRDLEIDHIIPCGGISGEDWLNKVAPWITKAFVEIDKYQRLCHNCHLKKTTKERNNARTNI